jgi:hypothetical protein
MHAHSMEERCYRVAAMEAHERLQSHGMWLQQRKMESDRGCARAIEQQRQRATEGNRRELGATRTGMLQSVEMVFSSEVTAYQHVGNIARPGVRHMRKGAGGIISVPS